MTIWRYIEDAGLEWLLYRLPDALFDPAWLNTEFYQRDRPPTPYFTLYVPLSLHLSFCPTHSCRFEDFLETPNAESALPAAAGFYGFFRGAWAYHWHNQWYVHASLFRVYINHLVTRWTSFDPARNYPDLGPRFADGEREAKKALAAAASIAATTKTKKANKPTKNKDDVKGELNRGT
jgi:WD repeat and SOF domain-containing protein 1